MDGTLSQDEINALLMSMDSSGGADMGSSPEPAAEPAASAPAGSDPHFVPLDSDIELTDMETDAIGEVANISMGSSATTLYSLVNRKVNITTPTVSLATWGNVIEEYEKPCVFIQIKYTTGLDGSNILVLKQHDVCVITDLMMGGNGENPDPELGELQLSAISEAMNQMMGASATSLSTMLGKMIDISPPEANLVDFTKLQEGGDIAPFLGGKFVKIAFRMQIDDLVDSTIMQLYPVDFSRELCNTFLNSQMGESAPASEPEPEPYVPPTVTPEPAPAPQMAAPQMGMPQMGMPQMQMPQMGMPQMGMPQMQMSQMGMPQMGMPQMGMYMQPMPDPTQAANIQPAQFQNFAGAFPGGTAPENIGLIIDVPLEVTVELGRTSKSIAEILDFAPGTILELDKIAGEPVDVLVNGKYVAKGEVVVIEESFGVRVTEIIK